MRGVVTLAAVLALPLTLSGDRPYPRALFIWLAFAVIVVTLVVQGATLPTVARRLKLPSDDPVQDALTAAAVQQQASRAARERLDALADRPGGGGRAAASGAGRAHQPGLGAAGRHERNAVAGVRSAAAGDDRRGAEVFRAARDSGSHS
jgi:CPA1 family monovalent cation:H+ antiporter